MFYVKKESKLFVLLVVMVGETKNSEKQTFPVLAPKVPVQSYCPLSTRSETAP